MSAAPDSADILIETPAAVATRPKRRRRRRARTPRPPPANDSTALELPRFVAAPIAPTLAAPVIPDDAELGVVDSVRLALRPGSRAAFVLGMLAGAGVPFFTYRLTHGEVDFAAPLWSQASAWFALGGLLFSAVTMYEWGRLAFFHRGKALGFVVLLEGTMVTSHTHWVALTALAYLCSINGVASASNLARRQCLK